MIANSAIIHPNVTLGPGTVVEDFCIIGCPPRGARPGELPTVIGAGAVIRSFTVIYAGNTIGDRFQTGNKTNIRESNTIGHDVSIGTLSVVEHHVKIEDGVRIHTQAFVPEFSHLMAGSWVGPNAVLTNALYPLSPGAKETLKGAVLEPGAKVGANCTLLPGVRVGRNSLVGAGSVVTRDVPEDAVVAGNPARVVKSIKQLPYSQG
jgi:acetyltransferase-like isoleucine patch superfamily enzyme